jgi:hypothetical protein
MSHKSVVAADGRCLRLAPASLALTAQQQGHLQAFVLFPALVMSPLLPPNFQASSGRLLPSLCGSWFLGPLPVGAAMCPLAQGP